MSARISKVSSRHKFLPGVYFRMLLVGQFESIQSQRGIAWQGADSQTIRQFLGLSADRSFP
ncbi:MAG: transposase [Pirellulaceae bacterium]